MLFEYKKYYGIYHIYICYLNISNIFQQKISISCRHDHNCIYSKKIDEQSGCQPTKLVKCCDVR